ncbi:MAG: DUF1275 domain-containing protein [Rhodospirillales bacterium]|nr:DUF1275 domain-containing protein [Rhodospirillales bacterium]
MSHKGEVSLGGFGLPLMAFASGSSDAMVFVIFGSVFTSAMTGNTALIGLATGKGQLDAAMLPLLALFGFISGVAFATALCARRRVDAPLAIRLRTLLGIEIGVLAAFTAVWHFAGFPIERPAVFGLVLLSAFAMGLQGVAAHRFGPLEPRDVLLCLIKARRSALLLRHEGA